MARAAKRLGASSALAPVAQHCFLLGKQAKLGYTQEDIRW